MSGSGAPHIVRMFITASLAEPRNRHGCLYNSVVVARVSRATCHLVSFLPFAAVAEILGEGDEVLLGLVA